MLRQKKRGFATPEVREKAGGEENGRLRDPHNYRLFKLTVIKSSPSNLFPTETKQKHNNSVVYQMCISIYCVQSNKNLVIIYQIYINDLSNKGNSVSR